MLSPEYTFALYFPSSFFVPLFRAVLLRLFNTHTSNSPLLKII
ncbi:hypothetical protein O59_000538 [Cellvibrio sp. BR]|nr:hypothetical protein O59_000538 [Cellvibrio sp. BR]